MLNHTKPIAIGFLITLIILIPILLIIFQKSSKSEKRPLFMSLLTVDGKDLTKSEWDSLVGNRQTISTMYAFRNYDINSGLKTLKTKIINNPFYWISYFKGEVTSDENRIFYIISVENPTNHTSQDEIHIVNDKEDKVLPINNEEWKLPTIVDNSALYLRSKTCSFSPNGQFLVCQLIHTNIETFINTYKFVYYNFNTNQTKDIYSRELNAIFGPLTIPALLGWIDNNNILIFDAVDVNGKTENITEVNIETGEKKLFMSYPIVYREYCYANPVTETFINGSIFLCYDNGKTFENQGKDHQYGIAEIDTNTHQIKRTFSVAFPTVNIPIAPSNKKNFVVWSTAGEGRSTKIHIYDIKNQHEQQFVINEEATVKGYIEELNKLVLVPNKPDVRIEFTDTFLYDLNNKERTLIRGKYLGYGNL